MSDEDKKKPKKTEGTVAREFVSKDRGKTLAEMIAEQQKDNFLYKRFKIDPELFRFKSSAEYIAESMAKMPHLDFTTYQPQIRFSHLSDDQINKLSDGENDLEAEVLKSKAEISKLSQQLRETEGDKEKTANDLLELRRKFEELQKKENRRHILERVNDQAKLKLIEDPSFFQGFEANPDPDSVVLSIDIRRSTDLMLKAVEPRDFAIFISRLADELKQIIVNNYGIYDKFTGDGILAFFPSFYSGEDSVGFALKAAQEAHRTFANMYKANRHIFSTIMVDAGVGIGIDYGRASMMLMGTDLTVVGRPVVYACRLAGCPSGTTLANQGVINRMNEKYSDLFEFEEYPFDIKHEGRILSYKVKFKQFDLTLTPPMWTAPSAGT